MDVTRSSLIKGLLVLTAVSFPIGLIVFNTQDSIQNLKSTFGLTGKVDLSAALAAKEQELKDIDLKILQARGEFLKYAEMRNSQVNDLETIKSHLDRLITTPIPMDPPGKQSSMNSKKSLKIKSQ
jgi:hypothetical protein